MRGRKWVFSFGSSHPHRNWSEGTGDFHEYPGVYLEMGLAILKHGSDATMNSPCGEMTA